MTRVLVVHHTPSPAMQELLEAAVDGVEAGGRELGVRVETAVRPALSAGAADVLAADAVILGTPANIGYMSGALKHFFDTIYYPCLTATLGMPYAAYIHGNNDTTGAAKSITAITRSLKWELLTPYLEVTGSPDRDARAACAELGSVTVAVAAGED